MDSVTILRMAAFVGGLILCDCLTSGFHVLSVRVLAAEYNRLMVDGNRTLKSNVQCAAHVVLRTADHNPGTTLQSLA